MAERLYAASKAPKRFLRVEGGTHHNLTANYFDEYRRAVAEHFGLNLDRVVQSSIPAIGVGLGAAGNTDSATR